MAPKPLDLPYVYPIDALPAAWSHDGLWVAFHRRQASADGPPGVYLVSSSGGRLRYVAPGDFFWPDQLHFSPDDRRLIFVSEFRLMEADLSTGMMWELVHTDNGVRYADWSPSGRYVLYSRAFVLSSDPAGLDSAGLHILDLATSRDVVVRSSDPQQSEPVYFARDPAWSRDEKQVAFIQSKTDHDELALINPDGSDYKRFSSSPLAGTYDYLRWYVRPAAGLEGLVYWQLYGADAGGHFVSRDGGYARPFERRAGLLDSFSPDGEWVVTSRVVPTDTTEVLFVERTGDTLGVSLRQLTHWARPVPGSVALRMAAQVRGK